MFRIRFILASFIFIFNGMSLAFADDVKIFDSGSKKFRLSVFCVDVEDHSCSEQEDAEKIKFEKLHVDDVAGNTSKFTLFGKAPVEGILVTRDEHLRIADDQIFQLTFTWDGGDQQIPLYLVEKDGSVFNFSILVKTKVEEPTLEAEKSVKKVEEPAARTKSLPVKKEEESAATPPPLPEPTPKSVEVAAPPPAVKSKSKAAPPRVFRSFPFEVEARLSGEGYNQTVTLIGGASFSGWLVFGKRLVLPTPRWGFDFDYDRNINSLQDQNGNNISFYRFVADLKYNLSGGGSNRDNLFGPLLAYETFNFGQATSVAGVGGFWSHPIYSGAESGLNYLKWFRHPKWLDAQAEYFIKTIDSTTLAGPTFNAAVRMKIYFRPALFYDFGISFSTADFKNTQTLEVVTSIFTATIGFGANF